MRTALNRVGGVCVFSLVVAACAGGSGSDERDLGDDDVAQVEQELGEAGCGTVSSPNGGSAVINCAGGNGSYGSISNTSYDQSPDCPNQWTYELALNSGTWTVGPDGTNAWGGAHPTNQTDCEASGYELGVYGYSGGSWSTLQTSKYIGQWFPTPGACAFVPDTGNGYQALVDYSCPASYSKFRLSGYAQTGGVKKAVRTVFNVRCCP